MRTSRFSLIVCALCIQIPMIAQTFHFISMFDTKDGTIGKDMVVEHLLVQNEMQTIAGYLEEFGYDSEFSDYYGNSCGRSFLMNAMNGLKVASNDVVVFYYGGHGARALNNESDPFPQMCLGESSERNWVPATLIKNIIAKKQPRLTVVLTGCCNAEDRGVTIKGIVAQSQGYTSEANVDKEAYKRLFIESSGIVQMTSSVAGEYSFCGGKPTGQESAFCTALLDVLDNVGHGIITANWETVCTKVKENVSSQTFRTSDGVLHKQHPDYRIWQGTSGTPVINNDDPTRKRRVNDNDSDLVQDLQSLLDKSQSASLRLQLVPQILSKHFTSDAKVLTLGRDMKTVVDYEDAETFLRRIAMSPYISQVNVVEQSGGKNSLVRVHEVRTR